MGLFSWMYSDLKNKNMKHSVLADSYLLVPKPFQEKYGKAIYTQLYDGYGHFGRYDVYSLVAEWNKDMIPEIISRIKAGTWGSYATQMDIEDLQSYYEGKPIIGELRELGIVMACDDKDNSFLRYPIKITSKEMEYEDAKPSKRDPWQGR